MWPCGFGIGEDGGEGGPARVGENPVSVFGNGRAYVVGQSATGLFVRSAGFEFGECGCEGVVGSCLKVLDGLPGGVGLVGVALRLVPAAA